MKSIDIIRSNFEKLVDQYLIDGPDSEVKDALTKFLVFELNIASAESCGKDSVIHDLREKVNKYELNQENEESHEINRLRGGVLTLTEVIQRLQEDGF